MIKPDIIFENDEWIALNKPQGLLSIPDREGKEISLKEILQEQYPQILRRVPQHYISSFLGITSVSLSRIRNRR